MDYLSICLCHLWFLSLVSYNFLCTVLLSPSVQFSSVQSLSEVRLFATPWTTARQASQSITNSRSPPKPVSIKLMMPSNHLTLLCPLLLLPSIPPSIKVFSNESALCIRWPKYWRQDWFLYWLVLSPCSPRDSQKSPPTPQFKIKFFSAQISLWSNSHIHTWLLEKP